MLFRAKGNLLWHVPAGGSMPVIRRPPPRDTRRRQMLFELPTRPPDPPRPEPVPIPRPQPGIDSRVWDHDAVALFSNVYRLGHWSEFSWAKLLGAIRPCPPS